MNTAAVAVIRAGHAPPMHSSIELSAGVSFSLPHVCWLLAWLGVSVHMSVVIRVGVRFRLSYPSTAARLNLRRSSSLPTDACSVRWTHWRSGAAASSHQPASALDKLSVSTPFTFFKLVIALFIAFTVTLQLVDPFLTLATQFLVATQVQSLLSSSLVSFFSSF